MQGGIKQGDSSREKKFENGADLNGESLLRSLLRESKLFSISSHEIGKALNILIPDGNIS